MQTGQRLMSATQAQVSSGKRIQKPSEDPNAAAVIMQTRASVRGIEQYQRNIGLATARVETEETVLNQLGDALRRALELAVSEGSDTSNATTRQQVKYEMDNLLRFVVGLGNTRFDEGYLFGGHRPDVPPFDVDQPLRPRTPEEIAALDQKHEIEIAKGVRVPTNHNGKEVLLDSGAIQALVDFVQALGDNDGEAIRGSIDRIRDASYRVQDLLGDIGGRYNHQQITASGLQLMHLSVTTLRSQIEDVDMSKAMIDLVARQTSLQSAMLATSRVINLNLADYLR
jgi:flagellar hook-associated protein 3 FlgL